MTEREIVAVGLVAGFVALLILTPLWIHVYQTFQGNKTLKRLASVYGKPGFKRNWFNLGQVAFGLDDGAVANLAFNRRQSRTTRILNLTISWPCLHTRIRIFKETFWTRAKKLFGMQDLKMGVPAFDDQFILQSDSSEELAAILNSSVQDLLLRLLADRFGSSIAIDIWGGQIRFSVETVIADSQLVKKQVDALLQVRKFMLIAQHDQELNENLTTVERDGVCLVCGDQIQISRVDCSRCRTPHHKECWEYVGSCSVFGCGEGSFVKQ